MNLLLQLARPVGLTMFLLTGLCCLSAGCGMSQEDEVLDAGAMLERYEKDRRRHDPKHFSEVDLGEYTVSVSQRPNPEESSILYIRFHLYGVVPDGLIEEFGKLLEVHDKAVRERVREVSAQCASDRQCAIDRLSDPSLGWLKSEIISSVNRILQAPILRDVVFGEFSFERG